MSEKIKELFEDILFESNEEEDDSFYQWLEFKEHNFIELFEKWLGIDFYGKKVKVSCKDNEIKINVVKEVRK